MVGPSVADYKAHASYGNWPFFLTEAEKLKMIMMIKTFVTMIISMMMMMMMMMQMPSLI